MIRDFDGVNGLSRAYDIGYDDGFQNGKAEAINEVYAIAINENHDTLIEWLQDHISD